MTCVSRSAAKAGPTQNAIPAIIGNPTLKKDMIRSFVM
jgi:hypothetical protein